ERGGERAPGRARLAAVDVRGGRGRRAACGGAGRRGAGRRRGAARRRGGGGARRRAGGARGRARRRRGAYRATRETRLPRTGAETFFALLGYVLGATGSIGVGPASRRRPVRDTLVSGPPCHCRPPLPRRRQRPPQQTRQ